MSAGAGLSPPPWVQPAVAQSSGAGEPRMRLAARKPPPPSRGPSTAISPRGSKGQLRQQYRGRRAGTKMEEHSLIGTTPSSRVISSLSPGPIEATFSTKEANFPLKCLRKGL